MEEKRCSTCKQWLSFSMFGKNKRMKDGFQNVCNRCKHDYWNKWFKRKYTEPEFAKKLLAIGHRDRLHRNLKKYGLSIHEYRRLEAKGCAICGGGHNGRGRFAFDHEHQTGKFRGLLCSKCNTAIGLLNDDRQLVYRAMKYLATIVE